VLAVSGLLEIVVGRPFVDPGLPRRLSARKGHPHYDAAAEGLSDRVDVFLDGKRLDEVTAWDVDLGRIDRHARDAAGRLILERGAPTFETAYGHVEVRWNREAQP
jgi:hypothetical protein